VSVADFLVATQRVDASSAMFVNGIAADLKDGVKVEVEGTMAGTVLVASKVIFRLEANAQTMNVQIVAPIQSKTLATTSLTVLGQSVKTTPLTQFIDRSSVALKSNAPGGAVVSSGPGGPSGPTEPAGQNGPTALAGTTGTTGSAGLAATAGAGGPPSPLGYADLQVGDRVDVMAYKDASGALVATRVERLDADPLLIAKGPVDAKLPLTSLTLFGIEVTTGVDTRYRDIDGILITDAAFYALVQVPPALPSVVRAQGIASATSANRIDATRTLSTHGEVEIAK